MVSAEETHSSYKRSQIQAATARVALIDRGFRLGCELWSGVGVCICIDELQCVVTNLSTMPDLYAAEHASSAYFDSAGSKLFETRVQAQALHYSSNESNESEPAASANQVACVALVPDKQARSLLIASQDAVSIGQQLLVVQPPPRQGGAWVEMKAVVVQITVEDTIVYRIDPTEDR
jgi:hypothetical protein